MNILIEMSLSATFIIIIIIFIRHLCLYHLPKLTFLLLWGVAICRLLIPYSLPSKFSIYSVVKNVLKSSSYSVPDTLSSVGEFIRSTDTPIVKAQFISSNQNQSLIFVIWLAGLFILLFSVIIIYFHFIHKFKTAIPVKCKVIDQWLTENELIRKVKVNQSDCISSPLTYGILKPTIIFPSSTDFSDDEVIKIILVHEFMHIKYFDALIKFVLIVTLCIHWFNPFVWLMYFMANRDIELLCDERVIKLIGYEFKSKYARILIKMEERKKHITPLINHFNKNTIEERIVAIMKEKKTVIGSIISAFLIVALATGFATSATSNENIIQAKESSIIESTGYKAKFSNVDNGSSFDIDLVKGGCFVAGVEYWNKGDDIVFRVNADQPSTIHIGILPSQRDDRVETYNDYGLCDYQVINITPEIKEVTMTVPETGEYGICIDHIYDEVENENLNSKPKEINALDDKSEVSVSTDILWDDTTEIVSIHLEVNKEFLNPLKMD